MASNVHIRGDLRRAEKFKPAIVAIQNGLRQSIAYRFPLVSDAA